MKNLFYLFLCIPFIGIAQTDFELEFSASTLQYVEMPNISSVIANSTTFSMSAWVYPQANPSAHSGIMGFRNNTDADFYLLQLQNSNNVEARFRNSAGTNFDIVGSNLLDLNQWQHLAFTYDGSNIHLYKDGVLISSTPANGSITQTNQSLKLGTLDWSGTGFYLNGKLDEIRLWDATLTQNEISNWMCSAIDLTHPNYSSLQGYWRLNEGMGAIANDMSVNANNGTLNNNPVWHTSTTCLGSPPPVFKTYVPDDNFETYLENNGMGDGILLNDSVFTSAIDTITNLDVSNQNIADLTGIEIFSLLIDLNCSDNQITSLDMIGNPNLEGLYCVSNQLSSLDVSSNVYMIDLECTHNSLAILDVTNNLDLEYLEAWDNQLTVLDVSNNINLIELHFNWNSISYVDLSNNIDLEILFCNYNQLTSLDVSMLSNLWHLDCGANQISSLDLSNNQYLEHMICAENDLLSLDVRNGNNQNVITFLSILNPNLNCIDVDDTVWSTANWTVANGNIDAQHYFSTDCNATAIEETKVSEKELFKITDVLGREILTKENKTLFYIYKDGTVYKKIIIE